MSTSSNDPADAVSAGSSDTAPLSPPIATSPPSSTAATSVGPPLGASPTLSPVPSPTLSLASTRTASPTPTVIPAPAGPAAAPRAPIGSRQGDLTPQWRYALATAWVIAFFAYAAVWQASVQIGIGTWWIGPRAQPTHTLVRVLPSLLAISMAVCAIYNVPRLVRLSAMGVVLATIVAIPDFSRSIGLGVAELLIAGMLGLVTAAALTGRYRLVPDHALGAPEPDLVHPDAARDTASPGHPGVGGTTNNDAAMGMFAPPDQTGP